MSPPSRNSQINTRSITFCNWRPNKLLHALAKLVLIALCFLVFLVSTVFAFFPLYVYQCIVVILAKIFRSDLISIVAPRDFCNGLDDVTKKSAYFFQVFVTYHGEPDIDHIRSTFQTKVMEEKDIKNGKLLYEKFTYFIKPWLGYLFWSRESNFSLHEHIRLCEDTEHLLLSHPVVTEKDFTNVMGKLSARPLRQGMSPWEILIVRNFVPSKPKIHIGEETKISEGSRFILIFRIHHAISDGSCCFKILVTNLSGVPVPEIFSPSTRTWKETFCSTILIKLTTLVLFGYYQFKQIVLDVDKNIWNLSAPQTTGEWLFVQSEKIPLIGLKQMSKSRNVSLTALFNAGLGAGIRTFLKGTGQEDKIPETMRVLMPLPWKTHPFTGLVNCWSFGTLIIPLGPCLQQNLQIAEKSIRNCKKSPILPVNFAVPPLLALFPARKILSRVSDGTGLTKLILG
ncbi:uncharacterized protein LOC110843597 isoform X2 [Folsomia candida]|uniref:uncharacterized protein LOC110843597 isoform X2 n=1 Tax=Folsomia candida TaxID=158441 RepID=UPI000B908C07|nr:uncharacterized protein LOC110843597 isoform X2 [Folsomia candida]